MLVVCNLDCLEYNCHLAPCFTWVELFSAVYINDTLLKADGMCCLMLSIRTSDGLRKVKARTSKFENIADFN